MNEYILLETQNLPVPGYDLYSEIDINVLKAILIKLEGQPIAFDYETSGRQACATDAKVRSISFANDAGCIALDFYTLSAAAITYINQWMTKQKLIAHNMSFDAAWFRVTTGGTILPVECYHACTLGLFKQLANEGWKGQRHGLKLAMKDVLGWPDSNEDEVYTYMAQNNCIMADVPWSILGKYNALDSAATWQLYKYFRKVIESYKNKWGDFFWEYHQQDFMTEVFLVVEQQWTGILIDTVQLTKYGKDLDIQIDIKYNNFFGHEEVKPHVLEYNSYIINSLIEKEPNKMTKANKLSKRWEAWKAKYEDNISMNHFNLNSPKQLCWLFYEKAGYTCKFFTEQGAKACGKDALGSLGEPGKLLKSYRKLRDQRKFATATENVIIKGRIHPQIKIPGTSTGRNAGGYTSE